MDSYFYLPKAFNKPSDYVPAQREALQSGTQHPELNSTEFYQRAYAYAEPIDFLPVFSNLERNDTLFVVATNNYTGSVFDSNVIVAKDFNIIANHEIFKTSMEFPGKSTVTDMKFLDSKIVSAD